MAPTFTFNDMISIATNNTGKLLVGREEKEIKDLTTELAKHKFELARGIVDVERNQRAKNDFVNVFIHSFRIISTAFVILFFTAAMVSSTAGILLASGPLILLGSGITVSIISVPSIIGPVLGLIPAGVGFLHDKIMDKIEDRKFFTKLLSKELSLKDGLAMLTKIHSENKKFENLSDELIDEQIDQMIQSINYIDQFRNELLDEELTQLDQLKAYYAIQLSVKNLNQDPAKNEIINDLLKLENVVSDNRRKQLVGQMMACPHSILLKSPLFFDVLKPINGKRLLENELYQISDKLFMDLDEAKKEIMIRNMKFILIKDDGLANEEYWSDYIKNIDFSRTDKLGFPQIINNTMIKHSKVFNASKKNTVPKRVNLLKNLIFSFGELLFRS
jgi:hypothetical protein